MFAQPPLSPQKSQSPRSESSPSRPPTNAILHKQVRELLPTHVLCLLHPKQVPGRLCLCTEQAKDVAVIPQFFFPGGPPVPEAVQRGMQAKLDSCFSSSPDGLTIPAVKDLMREVSVHCRCMRCMRHPVSHTVMRACWSGQPGVPIAVSAGIPAFLQAGTTWSFNGVAARGAVMDHAAERNAGTSGCATALHHAAAVHMHTLAMDLVEAEKHRGNGKCTAR